MMNTLSYDKTRLRKLLWSHAAEQIICAIPNDDDYEILSVGYGWGLRLMTNRRKAILLHPTSDDNTTGDLALTIREIGTHTLPRCGRSYPEYVADVQDIVETTVRSYLID